MSVTLGATAIRTARIEPIRTNLVQPRQPTSAIAAQSMPETREIPSREIRPKELREAEPLEFREFHPQKMGNVAPPPLDPPRPEGLEALSVETLKPSESHPQEPKDFAPKPFRELDSTPLDPRELKPKIKFEEMFFRPRPLRDVKSFDQADLTPKELKAPREGWARMAEIDTPRVSIAAEALPRNGTIKPLDLTDSETYRHTPQVQEIDPNLGASYKNRDRVIHTYEHDKISHWHYHYNPVPADDVAPPRNRNVVLPRQSVVVDRSA